MESIKKESIPPGDCWAQSYHDDRLCKPDGLLNDVGNVVIPQHFLFCNPLVHQFSSDHMLWNRLKTISRVWTCDCHLESTSRENFQRESIFEERPKSRDPAKDDSPSLHICSLSASPSQGWDWKSHPLRPEFSQGTQISKYYSTFNCIIEWEHTAKLSLSLSMKVRLISRIMKSLLGLERVVESMSKVIGSVPSRT